jgi:predicted nucleic acid-binding protein
MRVLVDSSVWIDYFRGTKRSDKLDHFIDENVIVTNDLILAELVPFLLVKNQKKLIRLLNAVEKVKMNVDWDQIVDIQYGCLKKGINGIGIPDLMIAQNALQNVCKIYSLDGHFEQMKDVIRISIIK